MMVHFCQGIDALMGEVTAAPLGQLHGQGTDIIEIHGHRD